MSKQTGVCKWFDAKKGIGFVSPESGDADIFVHQSAIQAEGFRKLVENEKALPSPYTAAMTSHHDFYIIPGRV